MTEAQHTSSADAAMAHHHPSALTYLKVGIVLFILTIFEVALFYLEQQVGALVVPLLLLLALLKFVLVAAFYMHLKFDGRLLSSFFVGPLLIAISIVLALMALFFQFVAHTPAIINAG